ncbi:MAG: nickel-dependent lactate racemase [Pelolinea sp.]|nr:nickel-dependent lactate racemase [Pelolinea sp.]
MRTQIAYGRDGLILELPDDADVLRPRFTPGFSEEAREIRKALRTPINTPPLREMVHRGQKVVIVHTDVTRATPNDRILPVILSELEQSGIEPRHIKLLNGLGTHRKQTEAELRMMLGEKIVNSYKCTQHDCFDEDQLITVGKMKSGNTLRLNLTYMEADIKILTGFIEPHFFAGFSGGPKAVLPALSGYESVFINHGFQKIAHPSASWGITVGNPIWEEMAEAAQMSRPDFLVNVSLNEKREITGVFAGDMMAAHAAGCDFVKDRSMVPVERTYDIVVTSNSGYPLDQNLYQSVKGMSAAARIVRDGGAIIVAAACEDGLPDHGSYAKLLKEGGSPAGVLEMVSRAEFESPDQWQVQIQAQIQNKAEVFIYSDGLTSEQIIDALCIPCRNIEELMYELTHIKGRRICVLPDGPQVIPYLIED